MVKLMEELGELTEAVLWSFGNQRKEKLSTFDHAHLESEFADVIISTLLLAHSMNMNIQTALESKIEEIEKRYEETLTFRESSIV